jgi:transcription initiation factor TFIIB
MDMQSRKRKNKPLLYQYYLQKENQLNNAITLANSDSSNQICPSCNLNSMLYDASTGETVCSNCGIVILERAEVVERDSKTACRVGMPTSLVFPDKGLPTVIANSNTDASGTSLNQDQVTSVNRIRHFNKTSFNNRSQTRNLKNAFVLMAVLKDRLALTDPLLERSAYHYRKALGKKLIKGRSTRGLVVASIYVSCKEMNIPRTLQEIARAANADYVFAGRCYRIMAQQLGLSPSIVDPRAYVSKIVDRVNVNQKTYRRAVDMLDEVKKNSISVGKDPKALASAVLYYACLTEQEGDKISQARIAKAGGVSIVTLRKRTSDVLEVLQS